MKSIATVFAALAVLFISSVAISQPATQVKLSECFVAWAPNGDARTTSYKIEYGLAPGGPYTFRIVDIPTSLLLNAINTPGDVYVDCSTAGFDINDVTSGGFIDYYIVLRAVADLGGTLGILESGISNETSARLHVPPGNPGNARVQIPAP